MNNKNDYDLLKGKNVLITGGTKGIGRATAILLAKNQANVFIIGRDKKRIDETIKMVSKTPKTKVYGLAGDVSHEKFLISVFDFIDKKSGGLDILINNASLGARSILDQDMDKLEYFLKVNLESHMRCTRLALDRMIPKNSGHIINIGSLSSVFFEKDADIYVSTKAAIAGFTKSIRKKVNEYSIKVSLIQSGSVATSMVDEDENTKIKYVKNHIFLKPEDIAELILFILIQPKRSDIMEVHIKPHKQFL